MGGENKPKVKRNKTKPTLCLWLKKRHSGLDKTNTSSTRKHNPQIWSGTDAPFPSRSTSSLVSEKLTMGDDRKTMTDDEKKLMAECEEEFKNRYTDDDPSQEKYKNFERKKPPVIDPWFNKPVHNSSRRNYGHGRRHQNWDRRYDRGDRNDKHAGRHHMYQRNSRPY